MKNWEPPKGYKEKKYNYTYKLTFKNDRRYYYYGVHCSDIEPKFDNYSGSGSNVKKLKKLFGKDCFEREILEFFNTKKDALLAEDKLVPIEILSDEFCLNKIQGGGAFDTSGIKMSEEFKKEISKRFKGKKRSEESIKKMIDTRRARGTDKHSEETKRKLSEQRKNKIPIIKDEKVKIIPIQELEKYESKGWVRGLSNERNKKVSESKIGNKNPMYGKHWSEESKKKMIETKYKNGTNFHSDKTKQILAEKNREKAKDPLFRKKLRESAIGKNTWSKGLKRINKNGIVKAVREEELEAYLNEGWVRGNGYSTRKNINN